MNFFLAKFNSKSLEERIIIKACPTRYSHFPQYFALTIYYKNC